ncbi:MAG TPA: 30S ribosomal protein S30 [Chloroflexi bacterium]|nr:30S ribosomal protein S30 [Chloroflexota bacterium]
MVDLMNLPSEFYNKTSLAGSTEEALQAEAARRLAALAEGHTDIVDASVSIEELTGGETPHRYQVRVVLYARPNQIVAVEKHEDAMGALKQALSAVERQVRDKREKLREQWRQP